MDKALIKLLFGLKVVNDNIIVVNEKLDKLIAALGIDTPLGSEVVFARSKKVKE